MEKRRGRVLREIGRRGRGQDNIEAICLVIKWDFVIGANGRVISIFRFKGGPDNIHLLVYNFVNVWESSYI